jgi:hypothetical protein
MISGKPVKSSIGRTSIPASAISLAVPPVETISTPSSASPRAKSAIPRLSETDSSARRTWTSPGAIAAEPVSASRDLALVAMHRGYRPRSRMFAAAAPAGGVHSARSLRGRGIVVKIGVDERRADPPGGAR